MTNFWETVAVGAQNMPLYASLPATASAAAPGPAVVVAQHATGVDEFIQDNLPPPGRRRLCRRRPRPLPPPLRRRHRRLRRRRPPSPPAGLAQRPRHHRRHQRRRGLAARPRCRPKRPHRRRRLLYGRARGLAGRRRQPRPSAPSSPSTAATSPPSGAPATTRPTTWRENINCPMLFHFGAIDENPSQNDLRNAGCRADPPGQRPRIPHLPRRRPRLYEPRRRTLPRSRRCRRLAPHPRLF